jgi:hypothetical protein
MINKLKRLMTKDLLCGACGQYIERKERDLSGYHRANLCAANDEIAPDFEGNK